jgi:hypothetical protein
MYLPKRQSFIVFATADLCICVPPVPSDTVGAQLCMTGAGFDLTPDGRTAVRVIFGPMDLAGAGYLVRAGIASRWRFTARP